MYCLYHGAFVFFFTTARSDGTKRLIRKTRLAISKCSLDSVGISFAKKLDKLWTMLFSEEADFMDVYKFAKETFGYDQ